MTNLKTKSLLLGSAVSLVTMGAAQAADLPVKAKATEYVRICSLYGAGFYYIPGSDTCLKIGGYWRVETALGTNNNYSGAYSGPAGAFNRLSNFYETRARTDLQLDTRTATEYGIVRTFFEGAFTWTSNTYSGTSGLGTQYGTGAFVGSTPGAVPALSQDGLGSSTLGVYAAFIQFAGFTMGKGISAFDAPWVNYPANNFDGIVGGSGSVTGVNQLTYTAELGGGVSFIVSAQDQALYYTTNLWNTAGISAAGIAGGAYGSNNIGGATVPDLLAKVSVDQAWGTFQAGVAAHNNHVAYYGPAETLGHPDDKWGFAGQLSLGIKNVPTGAGDSINLQGVYTVGASRYDFQSIANTSYAMYGGTGLPGAYQSLGIAGVSDAVFAPGTDLKLTTTYGFRGGFNHNWDPYWSSSLYGAWAAVRYSGAAKSLICSNAAFGAGAGNLGLTGTCNPDFNLGQIGITTRWTPVKNLAFSAELTYSHLDQKYSGTITAPAVTGVNKPGAVYELKNQDTVSALIRAQRNF